MGKRQLNIKIDSDIVDAAAARCEDAQITLTWLVGKLLQMYANGEFEVKTEITLK